MIFGPLTLQGVAERWPLIAPIRITGQVWDSAETLLVRLESVGRVGLGEAAGVFYKRETPTSMLAQLEGLRTKIEAGLTRQAVQELLPPGGARNALDCALWDLEAKLADRPVWEIVELDEPRPLVTTFTCGADTPDRMAAAARAYANARAIKLKLTGESCDAERVCSVRSARPDVWLAVDANQGLTRNGLEQLMPTLLEAKVQLLEQPFPIGQESLLDGLNSQIPIAADESVQGLADIPGLAGRFNVINIKLDKCGGLTEGLAMAHAAHRLGLGVMVGNTIGTSLAMAPAFLVGQLCSIVDLDGPVFLKSDRACTVKYSDGLIACSESVWGAPLQK